MGGWDGICFRDDGVGLRVCLRACWWWVVMGGGGGLEVRCVRGSH